MVAAGRFIGVTGRVASVPAGSQSEEMARMFDEALAEVSPAARRTDTASHGRSRGICSYRTADSVRWRFVYRRSDGTQTTNAASRASARHVPGVG